MQEIWKLQGAFNKNLEFLHIILWIYFEILLLL
jgi:hypothetical protein